MRVLKELIVGLLFIRALFFAWYAFKQNTIAASILCALGAVCLVVIALALAQNKSKKVGAQADESLADKANSRRVALQIAKAGGICGILARRWLNAYDDDPTVPIFGVRPYWVPTGRGGAPQILSTIGLRGIKDRLT